MLFIIVFLFVALVMIVYVTNTKKQSKIKYNVDQFVAVDSDRGKLYKLVLNLDQEAGHKVYSSDTRGDDKLILNMSDSTNIVKFLVVKDTMWFLGEDGSLTRYRNNKVEVIIQPFSGNKPRNVATNTATPMSVSNSNLITKSSEGIYYFDSSGVFFIKNNIVPDEDFRIIIPPGDILDTIGSIYYFDGKLYCFNADDSTTSSTTTIDVYSLTGVKLNSKTFDLTEIFPEELAWAPLPVLLSYKSSVFLFYPFGTNQENGVFINFNTKVVTSNVFHFTDGQLPNFTILNGGLITNSASFIVKYSDSLSTYEILDVSKITSISNNYIVFSSDDEPRLYRFDDFRYIPIDSASHDVRNLLGHDPLVVSSYRDKVILSSPQPESKTIYGKMIIIENTATVEYGLFSDESVLVAFNEKTGRILFTKASDARAGPNPMAGSTDHIYYSDYPYTSFTLTDLNYTNKAVYALDEKGTIYYSSSNTVYLATDYSVVLTVTPGISEIFSGKSVYLFDNENMLTIDGKTYLENVTANTGIIGTKPINFYRKGDKDYLVTAEFLKIFF